MTTEQKQGQETDQQVIFLSPEIANDVKDYIDKLRDIAGNSKRKKAGQESTGVKTLLRYLSDDFNGLVFGSNKPITKYVFINPKDMMAAKEYINFLSKSDEKSPEVMERLGSRYTAGDISEMLYGAQFAMGIIKDGIAEQNRV